MSGIVVHLFILSVFMLPLLFLSFLSVHEPTPSPRKYHWKGVGIASVLVLVLGVCAALGYSRGWHVMMMGWVQELTEKEDLSGLYEPLNGGPSQH